MIVHEIQVELANFPDYEQGIRVLILLLLASTLSFPIGSLTNFIVAATKSLRPFLVLPVLNGGMVLLTSFLLIPRPGIIGGGSVSGVSLCNFFLVRCIVRYKDLYVHCGRKEITLFVMILLIRMYEVLVDPLYLDYSTFT
jgi:O-antigen/teichoic acid export membrane protein